MEEPYIRKKVKFITTYDFIYGFVMGLLYGVATCNTILSGDCSNVFTLKISYYSKHC